MRPGRHESATIRIRGYLGAEAPECPAFSLGAPAGWSRWENPSPKLLHICMGPDSGAGSICTVSETAERPPPPTLPKPVKLRLPETGLGNEHHALGWIIIN